MPWLCFGIWWWPTWVLVVGYWYGYSCPYSCPKRELTAASNVSTTHSLYSILTSILPLVGLSIAELRRSQLDTGFLRQNGDETNCRTQSLHVLHRIRNGLFWDSVSGIRSHTGVTSKGWKVSHDGMGWSGCFSHLLSRYDCSHCAVIMTWLTSSSSFIFTRWGTTSSHLVLTSSNPFLYYCRLKSTGWSCWTLTLPTVQSSSFRRTCLTTHIHWPLLWPLSDWCVSNTVWLTCRNPWPISDGSLAWWFGPFKESESKLLHFWTLVSRPITNTQSDLHDQSWL